METITIILIIVGVIIFILIIALIIYLIVHEKKSSPVPPPYSPSPTVSPSPPYSPSPIAVSPSPIAVSPSPATGLINCQQVNPNYQPKNYTQWTDDDRNTAIWLLNNQDPNLSVTYLSGLTNDILAEMLTPYCQPISKWNCSQLNPNYQPKDYSQWTDDDRNTAVWLINNQNPALTVTELSALSNQILAKIVGLYCQ